MGTIYYVDTARADDTGDGLTVLTAKKTIGAAIALLADGDTIVIKGEPMWTNFSFASRLYKEIEFTDATQAFDLFTITGIIEIIFINGHVEEATNGELGNCLFRLYCTDGGTTENLTTATDCENLTVGSFIGKTTDATGALTVGISSSLQVIENSNYKDPRVSSIIVGKNTGTNTIQFFSDDDAGTKDGVLHIHVRYKPISNDGFLEPYVAP